MSNKTMENVVYNGLFEATLTAEDCEFPVKKSSRRFWNQRKNAAKKNRFPVGLRKEIYSERRVDKEFKKEICHKLVEQSDRLIAKSVIKDMLLEQRELENESQRCEDAFYADLISERYFDHDSYDDDRFAC